MNETVESTVVGDVPSVKIPFARKYAGVAALTAVSALGVAIVVYATKKGQIEENVEDDSAETSQD